MNKQKELQKLAKQIEICQECKQDKIGKMVFGEGNTDADVVFLGEAPGKQEAKSGRPFIGRSGQLLRKTIREVGLKEEDVYITSPVKYLPSRGTPSKEQIDHSRKYIFQQLNIINPKIIVLLGSTAAQAMLDEKIPVLQRHGETIKKHNRFYFLTLHPAATLRFQKFKQLFEEDFKKLKILLHKT